MENRTTRIPWNRRFDLEKIRKTLVKLFLLKVRFAMTGLVATLVDYVVYLLLVDRVLPPVSSNVISYSIAVVLNFLLQKRFVFNLEGSARRAFFLSVMVSVGGLALSSTIIYMLSQYAFFADRQYITKLCATGIVFFYNFYLKRYVFEKRFIS